MGLDQQPTPQQIASPERVTKVIPIGELLKNSIFSPEGIYRQPYGIPPDTSAMNIKGTFQNELRHIHESNLKPPPIGTGGQGEKGNSYCASTSGEILPFSDYSVSSEDPTTVALPEVIPQGLADYAKSQGINVVMAGTMHVHHEWIPHSFSPQDIVNLLREPDPERDKPIANVIDGLATAYTHEVLARTTDTKVFSLPEAQSVIDTWYPYPQELLNALWNEAVNLGKSDDTMGTRIYSTSLEHFRNSANPAFREVGEICLTEPPLYQRMINELKAQNNTTDVTGKMLDTAYKKALKIAVSRVTANMMARQYNLLIFRGSPTSPVLHVDSHRKF